MLTMLRKQYQQCVHGKSELHSPNAVLAMWPGGRQHRPAVNIQQHYAAIHAARCRNAGCISTAARPASAGAGAATAAAAAAIAARAQCQAQHPAAAGCNAAVQGAIIPQQGHRPIAAAGEGQAALGPAANGNDVGRMQALDGALQLCGAVFCAGGGAASKQRIFQPAQRGGGVVWGRVCQLALDVVIHQLQRGKGGAETGLGKGGQQKRGDG